jgi:integrase
LRTNEVRSALPEEFDLDNCVWSILGDRTKSGQPLRVPLCERAGDIVGSALPTAKYGYLFSGCKEGHPLSNMAMLILLKRTSRRGIAVHGFRSTFRDQVAEMHGIPGLAGGRGITSHHYFVDGRGLPASRTA